MKMLPVCSATLCCSSHSQIFITGGLRAFSTYRKNFEVRCLADDRVAMDLQLGIHLPEVPFATQATNSFFSGVVESTAQGRYLDFSKMQPFPDLFDRSEYKFQDMENSSPETVQDMLISDNGHMRYVDNFISSSMQEDKASLFQLAESADIAPQPGYPGNISATGEPLENLRTSLNSFISTTNDSIGNSFNVKGNDVTSFVDIVRSSIKDVIRNANETVDGSVNQMLSTLDQTGELVGSRLEGFSGDLKEAANEIGAASVDLLRHIIVSVEDSLTNGASFVQYSYDSVKELLPSEVQNLLNTSEEKATQILMPIDTFLHQVFTSVNQLERALGLDPQDPIVLFIILFGTSATLWIFYWILTYGGYSGDLSPQSTLVLLSGRENGVLIDVRPEDLRERDGIPDLRRAARFRYACVNLPEFNGSVRKLLKAGRDVDDAMVAAVIRNLKIIQDRSQVIIMDGDGSSSKGIARTLRKLGVKRPYLVKGGFRCWVKQGLRVKELKPETTLTMLNEEAEAILDEFRPTPLKVVAYSLGFVAATYSLLEWEKTLQLIGFFGLAQTIYRRVSSYQDSEDLQQDVRLLLTPVAIGAQAFSWVAGKLETNRLGLPTSPSSLDVRNRVLQAAAKHESQPSESEENTDLISESSSPPIADDTVLP